MNTDWGAATKEHDQLGPPSLACLSKSMSYLAPGGYQQPDQRSQSQVDLFVCQGYSHTNVFLSMRNRKRWHWLMGLKADERGAGEMAPRFRALAALPEDPGSIPSTCMETHNCLILEFRSVQHPLLASAGMGHTWCTNGQNTDRHKIKY